MLQKDMEIRSVYLILLLTLLLTACSSSERSVSADQAIIEHDLLYDLPEQKISFNGEVLPVLEKRCIACHGCYDAPCQLKLTTAQGVLRGANKDRVYDYARITATEPTRLFVDAMTTAEWRTKNFSSVLYEKPLQENNSPERNLEQSVLYRMLRLKQLNPQARTGMLSDSFDLSLDREQSCPTIDEFETYARDHAQGGMPFAVPDLTRKEYKTLVHWIAQGSPVEEDLAASTKAEKQIKKWESFLNGSAQKQRTKKEQLV